MLLTLPNPKYNEIMNKYNYLGGIQRYDTDTQNNCCQFILYWQQVIPQKQK